MTIPGIPGGIPGAPNLSSYGLPSVSSFTNGIPDVSSLANGIPGVSSLGSIPGLSGANLQSLLSQNLSPDALGALSPAAKGYLQQGLSLVSDLGPTYSLIDQVASGGSVNPQQAISALAGAATLVNPLAGAAVMAAGELAIGFESVLQDLGLVSETAKPVPYYGLIPAGQPIPSGGPGSVKPDPLWRTWPQFAFYWYDPELRTELRGWQQGTLVSSGSPPSQITPTALVVDGLMRALEASQGTPPGLQKSNATALKGPSGNAFEKFLSPMLQSDVESWANGSPFVDPRQLVLSAIEAWNDKHASSSADVTYSPAEDVNHGVVAFLLGSGGDASGTGRRMGSYSVHMGARLATPPTPVAGAPSPTDPSVLAAAGQAAEAALAAVIAQHHAQNALAPPGAAPAPAAAPASAPFGLSVSQIETFALVAAGAVVLILLTRRSP